VKTGSIPELRKICGMDPWETSADGYHVYEITTAEFKSED
jgi:hypothetical protein